MPDGNEPQPGQVPEPSLTPEPGEQGNSTLQEELAKAHAANPLTHGDALRRLMDPEPTQSAEPDYDQFHAKIPDKKIYNRIDLKKISIRSEIPNFQEAVDKAARYAGDRLKGPTGRILEGDALIAELDALQATRDQEFRDILEAFATGKGAPTDAKGALAFDTVLKTFPDKYFSRSTSNNRSIDWDALRASVKDLTSATSFPQEEKQTIDEAHLQELRNGLQGIQGQQPETGDQTPPQAPSSDNQPAS